MKPVARKLRAAGIPGVTPGRTKRVHVIPAPGLYTPKFVVAKKFFPVESALAGGATTLVRKGNESAVPRTNGVLVIEGGFGNTPEKSLLELPTAAVTTDL